MSGYIGGFTSHAMGGDFLKGAISAITVRAFNDLLHKGPPKLGRRRQWDFTDANEARAWSTGIAEETMKETFYIYNDETDMWMVEYRRKNKADAVYVDAEVRNIDGKKGIYVKRYHNGKRGNLQECIEKNIDPPISWVTVFGNLPYWTVTFDKLGKVLGRDYGTYH